MIESAKMQKLRGVRPYLPFCGVLVVFGGSVRVLGSRKLEYLIVSDKCRGIFLRVGVWWVLVRRAKSQNPDIEYK